MIHQASVSETNHHIQKNLNATDELSAPVELVPRRARKKAGN
jgi:hypothetical protein